MGFMQILCHFSTKNLTCGFLYPWGPGNNGAWIPGDKYISFPQRFLLLSDSAQSRFCLHTTEQSRVETLGFFPY